MLSYCEYLRVRLNYFLSLTPAPRLCERVSENGLASSVNLYTCERFNVICETSFEVVKAVPRYSPDNTFA